MAYQDPYQQYQSQYSNQGYPTQTPPPGPAAEFGHGSPHAPPQDSLTHSQYSNNNYPQDSYTNAQWQGQGGQGNYQQPYDPYVPPSQGTGAGHLSPPQQPYLQPDYHSSADTFVNDPSNPQRPYLDRYGSSGYDGSPQATPLIKPDSFHDDPTIRNEGAYAVNNMYGSQDPVYTLPPKKPKNKRRALIFWIILAIIVLAAAGVCIYLFVVKPKLDKEDDKKGNSKPGGTTGNGTDSEKPPATNVVLIGRNGDTVTMEGGETFTYKNPFGGYFMDATKTDNPFQEGAQAQSDTPPLNVTWDYGKHVIRGVNLGGWLVLEPFITPAFYQKYQDFPGFDSAEWTLSQAMRADTGPEGGIQQISEHYAKFITEKDFADIVEAGLNWIRLPIPYWAIETWDGEPFLEKEAWPYVLKAFEWARKYGLRINLDLHTIPGSQNGWNHSGKLGTIGWMAGTMGVANAQRSIDYMRIIVQFISQPQYKNVVPMFGIVNEPFVEFEALYQFYLQAYTVIRGVTGYGAGNGPILSIHDRFVTGRWAGFLSGADRVALDAHKYFAFDNQNKPVIDNYVTAPCLDWGNMMNESRRSFGVTTGGEWSLGYNDCGLFLVGGVRDFHVTRNCDEFWNRWEDYPQATKDQLMSFALSSMEGMRDFFFWTWKIAPAQSGRVEAPLWSYKLGYDNNWIPKDPSKAIGHCASVGVAIDPNQAFNGQYAASATGGAGAPRTIDPQATATIRPWPPTRLEGVPGDNIIFPTYTATGPVPTLPGPTVTPAPTPAINGWAFPQDTAPAYVPIPECTYPNAWTEPNAPVPAQCPAAA